LIAAIRLAHRARLRARGSADAATATAALGDQAERLDAEAGALGASLAPAAAGSDSPADDALAPGPSAPARDRETLSLGPPPPDDPFSLDARLVEAMRVLRTIEPRIGQLLRVVIGHRFYRSFGHASFDDYVRERLGISARKAWALLKIEKVTLRSPDFGRAYREGRLSWVRALSLLPVLDRDNAAAWIARAADVTVRRLNDEVDWVLASRDALGPSISLAPPPIDSRLPPPVRVALLENGRDLSTVTRMQIGAHREEPAAAVDERHEMSPGRPTTVSSPPAAIEVSDAEIRFTGPASVVALLRDVLDAFADPAEPRWTGLERLLRHVICGTSSPIGKARRAIPTRSSPATVGAARSRHAARAGTSTTTTSASARAAATTGATIARRSAPRTICTASTTARSAPRAPLRMPSNGTSVCDRAPRRSSRTWGIAIAQPSRPALRP
jgi:hypothetical protein